MIPEKKQIINKKTHQGIHNNTSVSIDKKEEIHSSLKSTPEHFFFSHFC